MLHEIGILVKQTCLENEVMVVRWGRGVDFSTVGGKGTF